MAAITTVSGTNIRRSGSAQADTGQCDWIDVPDWARSAVIVLDPVTFAGTTPIATLSLLAADPVARDTASSAKIAEHTALTGITASPLNEVQTLTLTAGIATETFKLTNGAVASSVVTIPVGGFASVTAAQIKTALLTIPAWSGSTDDIAVVKSTNDYIITFSGFLGRTDIGDTTVTDKVGAADGSVAETTKGIASKLLIVNVGSGITGIADDVTNSATAAAVVSINAPLPPLMGVRLQLDRTTGNETYTYSLSANFRR